VDPTLTDAQPFSGAIYWGVKVINGKFVSSIEVEKIEGTAGALRCSWLAVLAVQRIGCTLLNSPEQTTSSPSPPSASRSSWCLPSVSARLPALPAQLRLRL
jgi:hypothetical protein